MSLPAIVLISLCVVGVGVVFLIILSADIVSTRREQEHHRREFERLERVLGPIMKQWEEELRAEGLEVPPGTRRY